MATKGKSQWLLPENICTTEQLHTMASSTRAGQQNPRFNKARLKDEATLKQSDSSRIGLEQPVLISEKKIIARFKKQEG